MQTDRLTSQYTDKIEVPKHEWKCGVRHFIVLKQKVLILVLLHLLFLEIVFCPVSVHYMCKLPMNKAQLRNSLTIFFR